MDKQYLRVRIDGKESQAEIKRTGRGINKYSLLLDGISYTFQYNSSFYDDPHYKYSWVDGYLIKIQKGERTVIDCQIKHIKP